MSLLAKRHERFADLHARGCFVIPNPWDAGSARMMAALGAKALATTSAGFAFTLGRPDMGHVTRDEALSHAADIVAATDLPVTGDFENGFGDSPDFVAETIKLAKEAGLSGCSIEDTMMTDGNPAYEFDLAVERIKAAANAAANLSGEPFILCARADGVMNGTYEMDEAIRRIRAFEAAGANLLYIPLLPDIAALRRVVAAVGKPVNALAAGPLAKHDVAEIASAGARRISVGSMVSRITHAAIRDSVSEMLGKGSFGSFRNAASGTEIDALLQKGAAK